MAPFLRVGYRARNFLANEVGGDAGLGRGQAEGLFAQRDTLHEKGHVFRQDAHRPQAFGVAFRLAGRGAVHAIPVLARRDGHAGDGEKFVQLVEGGRTAAAPRYRHRRAHLHGLVEQRAGEQAREAGHQRGVGARVVHGRGGDEAVGSLKFGRQFVDDVVENALSGLFAARATDAAADIFRAKWLHFAFHAFGSERVGEFPDGARRVALGVRAANQNGYVHRWSFLLHRRPLAGRECAILPARRKAPLFARLAIVLQGGEGKRLQAEVVEGAPQRCRSAKVRSAQKSLEKVLRLSQKSLEKVLH